MPSWRAAGGRERPPLYTTWLRVAALGRALFCRLNQHVTPLVYARFPSKGCHNLVGFHQIAIRRERVFKDRKGCSQSMGPALCRLMRRKRWAYFSVLNMACIAGCEKKLSKLNERALRAKKTRLWRVRVWTRGLTVGQSEKHFQPSDHHSTQHRVGVEFHDAIRPVGVQGHEHAYIAFHEQLLERRFRLGIAAHHH